MKIKKILLGLVIIGSFFTINNMLAAGEVELLCPSHINCPENSAPEKCVGVDNSKDVFKYDGGKKTNLVQEGTYSLSGARGYAGSGNKMPGQCIYSFSEAGGLYIRLSSTLNLKADTMRTGWKDDYDDIEKCVTPDIPKSCGFYGTLKPSD